MAKKKLLTETQVRRFMGLAGLEPIHTTKIIKEMAAMYEEEPMPDEEMPPEEPGGEMEAGGEELPPEPVEEPVEEPSGEVELSPEDIKAARDAVEKLLAPLEAEMPEASAEEPLPEPEAELGEPAEEPEAAPEEEEQEVMEALSGINLQLSEDELVQEVAKRVAKRLIRAKKAQEQLSEALGRKK